MSKKYIKKDPIDHVLLRSSMYVGSKTLQTYDEYVAIKDKTDEFKIIKKPIVYSAAILRIFIEILSNAIDNVERSKNTQTPCTTIKVSINKETGETSVWNDGDVIPIEIHKDENIYNHTLLFGHMLTGSNYDDNEERLISGTNGLGSNATNIFSSSFTVNGGDPKNKKTFSQSWTNNMKSAGSPVIRNNKSAKGFSEVIYTPDFKQFNLDGYTDDIINLYSKFVIDTALLTKVKVYLNNERISIKDLPSYAKLYKLDETSFRDKIHITYNKNIEVLIMPSNEFQHIAFANGIYNRMGGQHVNAVCEAIFRPLLEKINKKDKPQMSLKDIKQFFRIFVICTVVNPEFNSQSKEMLEAPKVHFEIKDTELKKISKWDVITDKINDMMQEKEMSVLKKTEKKKKGFVKIDGFDQANFAGTKYSKDCSLIICEGLSAKNYVVAGIQKGIDGKKGRNYYSIFSLTGKILNVRNATPTVIAANKVITSLIQALNLKYNTDYTIESNFQTLTHGRVIILTDGDCDGAHICSLLINFFHFLFPSLLSRKEPFLMSMITPIVIMKKPISRIFYDENNYKKIEQEYINQNKKIDVKYYKGLGTFEIADVHKTFGEKLIYFKIDDNLNNVINKAFHKKFADKRKEWIEQYNPNQISNISHDFSGPKTNVSIAQFLNTELVKFSYSDCARSIPTLYDGLKQSQRKALYSVKKRNLTFNKDMLKVAQLGAYTAEHTNYHHGEANLFDTIIKMAQDFTGSNNIPLLYRGGMFGTRACPDGAASARYIYTKMDELTHLIYRQEDDVLLNYVVDDGEVVEPEFYIPIIPMILVNGAMGIGSGYSCYVPCHNPTDIIKYIKCWLDDDDLPELVPWYKGFKGKIQSNGKNGFVSQGIINELSNNKFEITELPIGVWTDNFKDKCDNLRASNKIKDCKNFSTNENINFQITAAPDEMKCNFQTLDLQTSLPVSNMVLFNDKKQLKKYDIKTIMNDFCEMRIEYYKKRKDYLINKFEEELKHIENKSRFINDVVNKKLDIMNIEEDDLIKELETQKFDKENDSYNYLLQLHIRSFTTSKINQMLNELKEIKEKLNYIKNITESELWIKELDEFEKSYNQWKHKNELNSNKL